MRTKFLSLLVIIIISLPVFLWWIKPSQAMPIIIVDKTVPNQEYREHKGLVWFINHEKYSQGSRGITDYIGFYPKTLKHSDLKSREEQVLNSPLLHLVDTYGVYTDDLIEGHASLEHSQLIYGGLSDEDLETIKSFTNIKGKTLLAEFNTFASPTPFSIRKEMEKILGVKWTGWIGRYFSDLSNDEIPLWMVTLYEEQYGEKWDFKDLGIVYVHEDSTLVVLEKDKHIGKNLLQVRKNEEMVEFPSANKLQKFFYWFDIITPQKHVETLFTYETDVTAKGKKVLADYGIPTTFPAVTRQTGDYTSYYFAGDFADLDAPFPPHWVKGMKSLMGHTSIIENQEQFFWKVYIPIVTDIYAEVYESYKRSK